MSGHATGGFPRLVPSPQLVEARLGAALGFLVTQREPGDRAQEVVALKREDRRVLARHDRRGPGTFRSKAISPTYAPGPRVATDAPSAETSNEPASIT